MPRRSNLQRKSSFDLSQAVHASNRSPVRRRTSLASPLAKDAKDIKSKVNHLKLQPAGNLTARTFSVCKYCVCTNRFLDKFMVYKFY